MLKILLLLILALPFSLRSQIKDKGILLYSGEFTDRGSKNIASCLRLKKSPTGHFSYISQSPWSWEIDDSETYRHPKTNELRGRVYYFPRCPVGTNLVSTAQQGILPTLRQLQMKEEVFLTSDRKEYDYHCLVENRPKGNLKASLMGPKDQLRHCYANAFTERALSWRKAKFLNGERPFLDPDWHFIPPDFFHKVKIALRFLRYDPQTQLFRFQLKMQGGLGPVVRWFGSFKAKDCNFADQEDFLESSSACTFFSTKMLFFQPNLWNSNSRLFIPDLEKATIKLLPEKIEIKFTALEREFDFSDQIK